VALDALSTWDDTATQVFASEVRPQAIRWLEDPCGRPSSLTATWLPLALGEHARSATGIRSLLNKHQLTALTIDVAWLGGISTALEALSFAQAAQVPVYPHGRAFLPGVHLAAAFPGLIPAVEYQVRWEPRRQELSRVPASPKGGHVLLPPGPGLGYPQEGR
jgi:L-alanine-DL-glutamate epimerase-like enolase superfamily enzyme